MPISIDFLANERDLVRGADKSADALQKVSDALDDVAADSQRSAGKMESEYKDAARGVQQSNDRLERSFQELANASKQSTKQAGDDFELSTREKSKLSKETIREIGDEAKQNAAETFSSFDGSAQSFVDGVQGTLGGLVSSLGPVGLAVGAAGALGIGLINGALQNADTNSQQFKADVADLTQALIDAGNTGEVKLERVVQILQKLATAGDESGVTLEKLNNLTSRSKNSFEDVAQAYAGNTSALHDLVKAGKERLEQLQREGAAVDTSAEAHDQHAASITDEANAQKDLNSYLEQAAQKADAAAKADKLYAESGAPAIAAKATAVQNLGQAYQDAAGDVTDYTDAETGAFDTDAYVAGFEKKAQALADFATNMQKAAVTLSPEAVAFLQQQGTDAASQLVSAYVNGTAAQQQQLAKVWSQAGSASSASYMNSFQGGIPSQIAGPDIVARWKVDDSALQAAIRSQVNVTVPVKLVDPRTGKAVW